MARENRTHLSGVDMASHPLAPLRLSREQFGRRLDAERIKRGWTQSELGRFSGIQRGSISEYINGRAFPTSLNLKRLADALGIEESALLPNSDMNAIKSDTPALSIEESPGHPGKSYLQVNRLVTTSQAIRIALILQETDAPADAE